MGNLVYSMPRLGAVFIAAIVLLLTTACDSPPDMTTTVYWAPPFIPIRLGVNTNGDFSANFSSSQLITPVGTFSIGATVGNEDGPPPIPDKHLRLRFRDPTRGIDDIRDVAVGDVPYQIYLKGEALLTVTNNEVVIDISEASCVQIIKAGNTEDLGCDASENGETTDGTGLKDISIGSRVKVKTVTMNIRTAPGMDASIITSVMKGRELEVVDGPASVTTTSDSGRPVQRTWWKVRGWDDKGRLGWSSGQNMEPIP